MTTAIRRHCWTVEDAARMVTSGVLTPQDRVELLDGEVVDKVVIGHRHVAAVLRLTQLLVRACADRLILSVQNPVVLNPHSAPEPDLAVLQRRSDAYATGLPRAQDVVVIIEVADSSAAQDRRYKIVRYAAAGIPEVWLVDLVNRALECYREPHPQGYDVEERLTAGDVAPVLAPWLRVAVPDLLGPQD